VQTPHSEAELAALSRSLQRGALFGSPTWVERTAAELGLESSLRPPGRPQKRSGPADDQAPLLRQEL
jgi:putative transposase